MVRARPPASYCYLLDVDKDLADEFDLRMRIVVRRVASVLVFGQIESDDVHSAAAVSVVLLLLALLVLLFLRGLNWRHARRGA